MKKRESYSAAEIEAYQARLHRQHSKEMHEVRNESYSRGYLDGKRDARNEMRAALGLEPEQESR